MAPIDNECPLARAREVRGADQLQDADRPALEKYREFLQSHEAESVRNATHSVLENYPDWWCRNRRAPPGLLIESDQDLQELYQITGTLYGMGIPLALAERRTPTFRFFQDIEVWGTKDNAIRAEELIGPDCELSTLLGKVVSEAFPNHGGFLDAAVFDATGLSQTKGVKKTSIRIVWPNIVVDSDRAARIRDLVVHRLASASAETGSTIAALEDRLRELSPGNAWHGVFGDAAYGLRSSVRLPLCDRVSPLPLRAPEHRPLAALGVLRYNFGEGNLKTVEWLCRQTELEGGEWVKIGALRLPNDAKLTEWSVPSAALAQPIPPSSTRAGRVKVRTAGGSEAMVGAVLLKARQAARAPAPPERAGQLLTVERRFSGSPVDFCDKMEQHMGKAEIEPDGTHVWKQPGGEARIAMYTQDQRVKVIGRPNQVRSLVVIVSPYTEAIQQMGCVLPGRPQPPQLPGGRAPSEAYAPASANANAANTANAANAAVLEEATALSGEASEAAVAAAAVAAAASGGAGAAAAAAAQKSQSLGGQTRVAHLSFESQGQGELAMAKGDAVRVTLDPEAKGDAGQDRWVFGRAEADGREGWFPLSHTEASA